MDVRDTEIYSHDPPGIVERYTAWASGRHDEAFGYAVGSVNWQCSDPIAGTLYDLHVMCEHALDRPGKFRAVKDWAYTVATSYAASGRQRYRLDWGRQAARDGLALALWASGGDLYGAGGVMVSTVDRAADFGVGERKYRIVRKHVKDQAGALIAEFSGFLEAAAKSPDWY